MSSVVRYQIFAADGMFSEKRCDSTSTDECSVIKVDASDLEFDPERENTRDRSATEPGQQFS